MCCSETISVPFIIHPPKYPKALVRLLVAALTIFAAEIACAQETIRIGFSAPITGPFAVFGKQMESALRLFIEPNGSTLAGKKNEVIVRDDAGGPDRKVRKKFGVIKRRPNAGNIPQLAWGPSGPPRRKNPKVS